MLRIAGAVQKTRELQPRILRLLPVIDVRQPHERRADEGADELARDVLGDVLPLGVPDDGEPERDRWVQMRAAELPDRERPAITPSPAERDDDPAAVLRLGLVQQDGGDHAVAEQDQ